MKKLIQISLAVISISLLGTTAIAKSDKAANRAEDLVWADGLIYDSILTGATFKKMPPAHSLDILYVLVDLPDQRPISDAAPGDGNYNGGRWWVHQVFLTEMGEMYYAGGAMELTSADDVLQMAQMGYFEIVPTETFFSCPLVGDGKPAEE